MEEFISKAKLEELSEVSEEFDAGRWKARFDALVSAVSAVASSREAFVDWLMVWLPAVMALQKLGMTLGRLVLALRAALVSSADPDVFRDDVVAALREDFDDLVDAFPDAGHWLLGVDELDRMIRAVLDDPTAREKVAEVGGAVTTMVDDVLARMVEVLLTPEKAKSVDVAAVSRWVENLEAVLQAALDRLNLGQRLFEK